MAINSQQSIIESKNQTKEISRTETGSWRSFGELSVERGNGKNVRKGAGTNW